MIFKKFKPFLSSKIFQFKDPSTGHEFTGTSIKDLITQIEGYRKQNDLEPLDFLPAVIENYLCHLPLHAGSCTPMTNPKRSVMQYMQGGIALLKNIAYHKFAEQSEADRRAEICVGCKFNSFPDRGYFVKWIEDLATRSVGERRSKHNDKLGICEVCSCPLRSKIFFAGKIKLSPVEQMRMKKEMPSCWQLPLVQINGK